MYCISELHFALNICCVLTWDFALKLIASPVQRLQHRSSSVCQTLTCALKPAVLITAPSVIPSLCRQNHLVCQQLLPTHCYPVIAFLGMCTSYPVQDLAFSLDFKKQDRRGILSYGAQYTGGEISFLGFQTFSILIQAAKATTFCQLKHQQSMGLLCWMCFICDYTFC